MKIAHVLVAALLAAGCSQNVPHHGATRTASLLAKSDSAMAKTETSAKKLDSVTEATAKKVTFKVKELTRTITKYQNIIKVQTKVKVQEKVIHDTVYVETKKSFWGKTKQTVTGKSDSTVTLSESENVVDSTQK